MRFSRLVVSSAVLVVGTIPAEAWSIFSVVNSGRTSRTPSSAQTQSPWPLGGMRARNEEDFSALDVSDILKETEEALASADALLKSRPSSLSEPATSRTKPSTNKPIEPEAIASSVGGAVVGYLVGLGLDVQMSDVVDVQPVWTSASFAILAVLASLQSNAVGKLSRTVFGKPPLLVAESIRDAIQRSIDASIQGAQRKVENTVQEIQQIPSKAAQSVKSEIQSIPNRVQAAAKQKVAQTQEEIAAIPVKMQSAAARKIQETRQEIASIPSKTAQALQAKVSDTHIKISRNLPLPDPLKAAELKKQQQQQKKLPSPPRVPPNLTFFV